MALVEIPVPHLLGGVSQQPAANRTVGQSEAADNCLMHVVNGLTKRKGTRHLARLISGTESVIKVHTINRDSVERYKVLIGERRVRVFDLDGREYPVLDPLSGYGPAGRPGTPIVSLDPRRRAGPAGPRSNEDFVIAVGNWQSAVGNSVTSYIAGRGPFNFGREQSVTFTTADTVSEVGNDAAALISDIYQDTGQFGNLNVATLFVKTTPNFACNDVELALVDTTAAVTHSARFDIAAGVVTVGAFSTGVVASVQAFPGGWYRVSVLVEVGVVPTTVAANLRRYQIRFHTNAATPANKRVLLFGAALETGYRSALSYIFTNPDLFKVLTIADTTFLVNTETVVQASGSTAYNPSEGFVFVKQGGTVDTRYTVRILAIGGGGTTFTYDSGAGPAGLRTDLDVAESLRTAIDADPNFSATRQGSVIRIQEQLPAGTFSGIETSDSRGDVSMVGFWAVGQLPGFNTIIHAAEIKKFSDLPLICLDGYKVKVAGDPERGADDYYVQFVSDSGSASFAKGKWEETRAPGVTQGLSSGTMPSQLIRRQDNDTGTLTGIPGSVFFTVERVFWDDRLVGDTDSNPDPSFVGNKISDIFLYRGRLGFLSGGNVILSEAGEVLNFFRTTVLDLLDTDPIDVNSGSKAVANYRNAATSADSLMMFTDREQHLLVGEPTLNPSTAAIQPLRAFSAQTQVQAIDSGRGILFADKRGSFSGLYEAVLLGDQITFRFEDLSVQAPRYIAGNGLQLAHEPIHGLTAVLADGSASNLFVHQSFWDDSESRLQSAWFRWLLHTDALVREMAFIDTDLVLVTERAEGWFLESASVTSELLESGKPITHLDRRLTQSQLVSRVYSGFLDTTVLTLPYTIPAGAVMQVVDQASGLIVPVIASTATTLTVHGDFSTAPLYIGEQYAFAVTLSEPVIQEQGQRGVVPKMGRPVDVHYLHLYLAGTAFLEASVARDLRTATVEEFSAAGLGSGLLLEGTLNLYTGDATFSIIGSSTQVDVTLRNDTPFPCAIESARWECRYEPRAQSVR